MKAKIAVWSLAFAAAAAMRAGDVPVGSGAVGLRCEQAVDPLGVDAARPRLSWRWAGTERGASQSAWQVLAATAPEGLAPGKADLWDSGKVLSDVSDGVPYAGAPLASSQRVFWKVRVWNREGRPSEWSAPAGWIMGLLAPADWKGSWIACSGATESLLLRREFTVRPGLRRAVVHVCGLGHYELEFAGRKVGDDLLTPGWTDYARTTLYDTYEVTGLLRPGPSAVGLLLGNGMYNVTRRGRYAKFAGTFGALKAIVHLRLEYADGTVEFIGTDDTWRVAPGPITAGNAYEGEDWDARLEPVGWSRAGFDDRRWQRAAVESRAGPALRGFSAGAEPVRKIELLRPVAQWTLPDGSTVYDLGQNAALMPRIRVTGPAGSAIRIHAAELVNPDGTLDSFTMGMRPNRAGYGWWQYTKGSDGEETWGPRFCYLGCRYLRVQLFAPGVLLSPTDPEGAPVTVDAAAAARGRAGLVALEGWVVHSSAAPVGHFATSNDLLNRIHALVRWAQRSNLVSVLTDCPHREKLGWLEQYHLNGPSLRYEFDLNRLYAKGMHDMADAQHYDGHIPEIAPAYLTFPPPWEEFNTAAEWGAAFFIVPWQQYEFTGDSGLIRTYYPEQKRYFAYLESKAVDGILSEGLGDWCDLGPAKSGHSQLTLAPVTATAFYYEDARLLAREAELLGAVVPSATASAKAEARAYADRAEKIRAAFNRRFFNAGTGAYAGGTQCADALALVFGLADPADRDRVLAALVRDIEAHGYGTTAGDIGFRFVLQALAQGGRSDVVYRMTNQDERPGYGYQLRHGATSLTEAWDANRQASQDHFMLGQIVEWFYRDLAGIDFDPAAPGFKRVVFHPQPVGDLRWVEASYDSVRGPIFVRWEHEAGRLVLRVTVPGNSTGLVRVPAKDGAVREGGAPAEGRPGVTFIRREKEASLYAIESGSYVFESKF